MNPVINSVYEENNTLRFTMSGINVSLANAIRRIILSEIPVYVFNTDVTTTTDCIIEKNTTRLHNEILKQRLGCVPIHMKVPMNPDEEETFSQKYVLEVDVTNETDNIIYVTTGDFKLRNILNDKYCTSEELARIFPKNEMTQSYIDFARLRPMIGDNIPGESLKLTSKISISNAKQNSMFNVVSICAYGNTVDEIKKNEHWDKYAASIASSGELTQEEIDFQKKNYELLDAQRQYVPDSFDFVIQTIGIYDNMELVKIACMVLQNKFVDMIQQIDADNIPVVISENTMDNCFDIVLENEDYTVGKVLEYLLYENYYMKDNLLNYCGFKKFHPHDNESIIRVAFIDHGDKTVVKQCLKNVCVDAQELYRKIFTML
jgi:DNA-directed RNA polymerase subunit L